MIKYLILKIIDYIGIFKNNFFFFKYTQAVYKITKEVSKCIQIIKRIFNFFFKKKLCKKKISIKKFFYRNK